MNKRFFGWLDWHNFMDTCEEWHAFVEGFCGVICPWPPQYDMSEELLKELRHEHHYYMFGRALGIITWIGIVALLRKIFRGVQKT